MNHECTMKDEIKEIRKKTEDVIRLNTLVNQNVETLKEQNKVLTNISKTMIKLSDNLSVQHETLKELKQELIKTNSKVEELDKKVVNQGTVNIWDNFKKAIPYLLVAGFIYVLSNGDKILNLIK